MLDVNKFKNKIDNGISKGLKEYKDGKCKNLNNSYIENMMSLAEQKVLLKTNKKIGVTM